MSYKKDFKRTSEFGDLVDSTREDFLEYCSDKNLGYVSGLLNYLRGTYQSLVRYREDLIKKIKDEKLNKKSEEFKTLQGVYVELMKLEEKCCLCVQIIKERELN